MSKFSFFAIMKLCFKLIFDSISGNCDPLFSQKNFDCTHFWGFLARGGGACTGVLSGALCPGSFCTKGLCPGT